MSRIEIKDDVILELCVRGDKVCMQGPFGIENELLYFYIGVFEDFRVDIPFTFFVESYILKVPKSIPPSFIRTIMHFSKDLNTSIGV